ncbi:MAG: hemolysin family protein [Deltaproteobacteria bacterium]|jgi:magnesium and cobalt transporter|nr:hemolysin family protein [Deltaproteobacteria bacterium]MCW8892867.1 hemolysin family protein [Deltaproteobacteria bacterium]MCW9049625.1 hemolysin family protein [Deltaproteobacteria bacterium]
MENKKLVDNGHSAPEPDGIFKRLARRFSSRLQANSEEELQELIDASEQQGIINEHEGDMLQSILELDETILREIMVPRTAMVCADADAPFSQILSTILKSGHSRIPVYKGNVDNIIGLVYAKDLLRYWGRPLDDIPLAEVLRPPYLVPESKQVSVLLKELRESRVHIAIVIDEYGGTSGLVTIEDVIEEIVGDIQDEYDREEEWLVAQPDGSVLVDGRLNVEEFEEYFDVEVAREKFDTVGGYVVEQFGRVPVVGEQVKVGDFDMLIEQGDQRAIRQLRIFPLKAAVGEPPER